MTLAYMSRVELNIILICAVLFAAWWMVVVRRPKKTVLEALGHVNQQIKKERDGANGRG